MTNKIKIQMGQMTFEAEGDGEFIERERQHFFSFLPQAINALSPFIDEQIPIANNTELIPEANVQSFVLTSEPNNAITYESIAGFLNEKSFATDVDIILGIAYYLDKVENVNPFNTKDIEAKLAEARKPKPSNINASINKNIGKSFLCETKEKKDGLKSFSILSEGIKFCETYKTSENVTKKKATTTRKAKKSIASPLLEITTDELNIEAKYCDITNLDKLSEQVLVIMLMYTQEKSIEYFTLNDIISVLKDKFSLPAPERAVRYVFEKGGTKFDKKMENGKGTYKLLSAGIKEAQKIIEQQKSSLPG